jgi:hypothetical protein
MTTSLRHYKVPPAGHCPECGQEVLLLENGLIAAHWPKDTPNSARVLLLRCLGTLKEPKEKQEAAK